MGGFIGIFVVDMKYTIEREWLMGVLSILNRKRGGRCSTKRGGGGPVFTLEKLHLCLTNNVRSWEKRCGSASRAFSYNNL